MKYFNYIVEAFYNSLEDFFNSFKIVSGRVLLRVLLLSLVFLFISMISHLSGYFTFVDIPSSIFAVVFLSITFLVFQVQKKDIAKFKQLLKGDSKQDEHNSE